MKNLLKNWQVGDGREQAVLDHVLATAPAGDIDAVIAAIDGYAYEQKYLINVGDRARRVRRLQRAAHRAQAAARRSPLVDRIQ